VMMTAKEFAQTLSHIYLQICLKTYLTIYQLEISVKAGDSEALGAP
jgi:hypothetical protein